MTTLQRIVGSMRQAAQAAGVEVVTGDTKVVDRGKGDGLFINTAGIGLVEPGVSIGPSQVQPGDGIILDNLGSHKAKPARQALRKVGAHLLFLPPYSPDLNPIEMMFAKLKTMVRKADERAIEAIWKRVGKLLDAFAPQECAAYLRHAGYGSV